MPNDAKLGLLIGVVIVLIVAGVFFRKDSAAAGAPGASPAAAVNTPAPAPTQAPEPYRPVKARPASAEGRRHTVREGDTLFSLAERFYGKKEKFAELYLANREVLASPDPLTPGTVLVIPSAAPEGATPEDDESAP